jgi:hypothetical protein
MKRDVPIQFYVRAACCGLNEDCAQHKFFPLGTTAAESSLDHCHVQGKCVEGAKSYAAWSVVSKMTEIPDWLQHAPCVPCPLQEIDLA